MKAKQCDECEHMKVDEARMVLPNVWVADVIQCAKNHKPRFYMPKSYLDFDYGWKRRCEDFKEKNT